MEGKEQRGLFCNYDCLSEVSRNTAALLFPSTEALKVELWVVCVHSNNKSDLSFQTNIACLLPVYDMGFVCVDYDALLPMVCVMAACTVHLSQSIVTTLALYAVGPVLAAKTALTRTGMDSTRPLQVPHGIWHQNVSSKSFKSCKVWGGAAVDKTCSNTSPIASWWFVPPWRRVGGYSPLTTRGHPTSLGISEVLTIDCI